MEEKEGKTNIFIKILIFVVIIGLAIGAIFLGKYLAELNLEKNGSTIKQNTNTSIPLNVTK